MPAALPASGAGRDHAFEIAVEGHAVAALPHQPPQIVRDVEILEEQHRALRRRPPFQRRDMRERVEPAPVGGEQRRQREIVHDAGQARRVGERALGIGQGVVGREQLVEAEPGQVRQAARCASASAPRRARASSASAFSARLSRNSAARRSRPGGCGKRHMIGVVGQTRSPNVWKWRKSWPLSLTGGLMEGYLNRSKSGVVNRSLTPP